MYFMVLWKSPPGKLPLGKFSPIKLYLPVNPPQNIPIKFPPGLFPRISLTKGIIKGFVSHLTLLFVHKRGEEGVRSLSLLDGNV